MNKSIVEASIALALGASSSAYAGILANSTTYTVTVEAGSCFAFGDCTPLPANINGGSFTITTDATGDGFSVGGYNVGTYSATSGGVFTTGGPVAGSGTVNDAGAMDLDFAGRTGSAEFFGYLGTPAWNIDDSSRVPLSTNTDAQFTTGSMSAYVPDTASDIALTLAGSGLSDNGDGTYSATLVSVSNIGEVWGSFSGTPYSEVYNVTVSAIPVPAAVWLFGSGLLGLVGIARRRKAA